MKCTLCGGFKWGLVAAMCLVFSGCGTGTNGTGGGAASDGSQYLLSVEPADASGVIELAESLTASGEPADVTLIGRVGGLSQPTWDDRRAAFMVCDLSLVDEEAEHDGADQDGADQDGADQDGADQDGAPKHDADACPFCSAKKKKELAALAMIEIVDAEGNTPAVEARRLLGISEGQTVVVKGTGQINSLGTLVLRTSSVYVKP